MKTCSVQLKRHDQYEGDNCEKNDKTKPLYTLSTMINIFHDNKILIVRNYLIIQNVLPKLGTWILDS